MSSLSSVRTANAAAGKFPGRRAVVVGGTSGIGCAIALRLAQADFCVTVVGRNAAVGAEVVAEMRAAGGRDHEFVACDSQLIANAYTFGNTYASKHDSLDVLVMTQGIATMQGRTETSEGLDQKLALHYYSRMAFVDALLPLLRRSTSPRVLTVLSAGVHNPYARYSSDPDLKQYSLAEAANSAGFYNDIAMDSLSRQPENSNIVFVHAAPGFVNTNWGKELNAVLRAFVRFIQPLGRRPRDCAEFMCSVLLQPRQPGFLLMGANTQVVRITNLHDAAREAVWAHTVEVLGRVKRTLSKFVWVEAWFVVFVLCCCVVVLLCLCLCCVCVVFVLCLCCVVFVWWRMWSDLVIRAH